MRTRINVVYENDMVDLHSGKTRLFTQNKRWIKLSHENKTNCLI